MQKGLDHIIATRYDQINLIKNGWADYTQDRHGEYVDVTIISVLPNGVCCEVQLLTRPLYDFKKSLHNDYGMMRIINSPKGTELSSAIKNWTESVEQRPKKIGRFKTKMGAVARMARQPVVSSMSPPKTMKSRSKGPKKHKTARGSSFRPAPTIESSESPERPRLTLASIDSAYMGGVDDSGSRLRRFTSPASKKVVRARIAAMRRLNKRTNGFSSSAAPAVSA